MDGKMQRTPFLEWQPGERWQFQAGWHERQQQSPGQCQSEYRRFAFSEVFTPISHRGFLNAFYPSAQHASDFLQKFLQIKIGFL